MESFYGGRQGISFTIVKRYPSIENMCTEFYDGGESIDEVNYGEYVIIDSLLKDDTDNGKVFRREMNYKQEDSEVESEYKDVFDNLWKTASTSLLAKINTNKIKEWSVSELKSLLLNYNNITENSWYKSWKLYNSNSALRRNISNLIDDWNSYIAIEDTDINARKEKSEQIYNNYQNLLYESFSLDDNGLLPSDISIAIDEYTNIKTDFDKFNQNVDWTSKSYCANTTSGYLWGGAKYIGQILGPKSASPFIKLNSYDDVQDDIDNKNNNKPTGYVDGEDGTDLYNTSEPIDLVSGKENDDIKYNWAALRDCEGNIIGCEIGFKIPYSVIEYTASSISPYNYINQDEDFYNAVNEDGTKEYYVDDEGAKQYYTKDENDNLIYYNQNTKVIAKYDPENNTWTYSNLIDEDDQPSHPFYQHHNVYIPKGIKGDTWNNIRKAKVIYDIQEEDVPGLIKGIYELDDNDTVIEEITLPTLYIQYNEEDPDTGENETSYIEATNIGKDGNLYYIETEDGSYTQIDNINSQIKMFNNENIISYLSLPLISLKEIKYIYIIDYYNYDAKANPTPEIFYLGNDNTISNVNIEDDGTIIISYNYDEDTIIPEQVKWIDEVSLLQDGTINIKYNNTGVIESLDTKLSWLNGIDIDTDTGTITYHWNHAGDYYSSIDKTTTTKDINYYQLNEDGTQEVDDNGNPTLLYTDYTITADNKIKFIKDIKLNNSQYYQNEDDDSDTWINNQKIQIQYTTNEDGTYEILGDALNYIAEAAITTESIIVGDNVIGKGHLLLYFSDPELRSTFSYGTTDEDENIYIEYTSTNQINKEGERISLSGWYDAGLVNTSYGLKITGGGDNAPTGSPSSYGMSNGDLYKYKDTLYYYDGTQWLEYGPASASIDIYIGEIESSSLKNGGIWIEENAVIYGSNESDSTNWQSQENLYNTLYTEDNEEDNADTIEETENS